MNYPTTPLEAIGADGAFKIGGGDFDFGQGYTEGLIKDLFEVPLANPANAIEILTQQLKKLPLEALQTFKHMIPGTVDDDFIDIATSVTTIIGNLANLPKALLTGDFEDWLANSAFTKEQWQAFLDQIKGAVGGTVEDLIAKFNHTRDEAIQIVKDLLTGLTGASDGDLFDWINGLGGVFEGIINPNQLPLIPLSHIGDWAADLLPRGALDGAVSVDGGTDWVFDPTVFNGAAGRATPGSAKTIANGTSKELMSEDLVYATAGQTITVTGFLKHLGLTATGNPIEVGLQTYSDLAGTVPVSRPTLYAPTSPTGNSGGTGGWLPVSGNYTVEPTVKTFRVRLTVKPGATAGAIHFDRVMPHKSGGFADKVQWLTADGKFDASKIFNLEGIGQIPNGLDKIKELQDLVDAATNALSGASQTGTEIIGAGLDTAKATFEQLFGHLSKITRDVQALQSEQLSSSTGGRRFNVDFGQYADGPFPSGLFNIVMSGSGSSSLAIKGGKAVWNMVNDGPRTATCIFPTPTLTPFQVVRGTMSSPPEQGSNPRPSVWAVARSNAAGTDYVFARGYCTGFLQYKGDIGCVKNGIEYLWASNVSLTWSLDISLICGVGNNPRRHQVLSGDTIVVDVTEPAGAQSVVDDDHCYWGSIVQTNGSKTSGAVAGASVADNAPPAVVGTTFRASRRSGADVTVGSGGVKLPNNFFETVDYVSPDLKYMPGTNCRVVAEKQGTYIVQYRILHGAYFTSVFGHGLLYKNGVPYERGSWAGNQLNLGFSANTTLEDATYASFVVPLNPGDYIEPGYHFTASMSNTGDAAAMSDGSQSWFAVAKIG
ncbi:minor tail protein [Mycobacterium phage EvilGenius]|uniref:Minor tail protein n=1 Tax=Mycobacterium phage EvilGenius TaxID=1821723 RepID=A0A143FPD0_9CAUD|nr:minor tail protein [Mycobacterium phage EvilGenius]AMW64110.1 minor tail protein [Mycobacterium phage EvilGenius]